MCGIAGIAHPDAARLAREMGDRLVHRGPDDRGLYADPGGAMAIAATRLSIIDVAGGHQPIASEDGSVWAALNGEIYNFRALRKRLEAAGHRFATHCDTEVLVHLYEEHGSALAGELEGMFAFAIWDERRGRLLLGRDRCGEKPLFLHEGRDGIAFASELGALLAGVPDASWEIDPAVLDAYFVLGYVPPSSSLVAGVTQLAPGSVLEWEPGSAAVASRYWSPPEPDPASQAPAAADLAAEFEGLLTEAVRSRMISDVPLGLFLSGGLDSTLVTHFALTQGQVRTFSVGYDVGSVNETTAAAAMARRLGTPHEELILGASDVAQVAPRVLARIDQPLADQALVPLHALAAEAARSVKVILGGEGADEFFAGYPRYRWLQRAERLRGSGLRAPVAALAGAWPGAAGRRLSLVSADVSAGERNARWVTAGRSVARSRLYGERLREAAHSSHLAAGELRLGPGEPGPAAMSCDQRSWLPGDVLTKADRAGMLSSLEIRAPFLHRGLIERAGSLPFALHTEGGEKALLRAVLERVMPGAPPPRKRGFTVPAADWLRGPLRDHVEHCADGSRLVAGGWFDPVAVAGLVRAHLAGDADHAAQLWPLLALNLWLEGPHGARVA